MLGHSNTLLLGIFSIGIRIVQGAALSPENKKGPEKLAPSEEAEDDGLHRARPAVGQSRSRVQ